MINAEAFLTMVVHAEAKKGKTTFGSTAPKKILYYDAEAGGMRFIKGRKIEWDPMREDLPDMANYDICVVKATSSAVIEASINVIESMPHPFKSFVFDSVTEYQERMKREQSRGTLEQKDWNVILTKLTDLIMRLREIVEVQDNVECLIIITGTEFRDDKFRPMLQGGMKNRLSYKLDAVGFLYTDRDDEGKLRRVLRIEGDSKTDAGNRFPGEWPEVIWDPDVVNIMEYIDQQVTHMKEQENS